VIKDLFTNIFVELFLLIIVTHYIQNMKYNLFNYYHNCYKLGTITHVFITNLLYFNKTIYLDLYLFYY
jgi:hypothetical protein